MRRVMGARRGRWAYVLRHGGSLGLRRDGPDAAALRVFARTPCFEIALQILAGSRARRTPSTPRGKEL